MERAKEAGRAIGEALKTIQNRLEELEGREPRFDVPVPTVEVAPAEIDMSGIEAAITALDMTAVLAALTDKMAEENALAEGRTAALVSAVNTLGTVVNEHQRVLAEALKSIAVMGAQIEAAATMPKELIFDADGEPIGIRPALNKIN